VGQPNFYTEKLKLKRAILAPMAGYTDAPFRYLAKRYGSAWAVTEMVSAKALLDGNMQGLEIAAAYRNESDLVIQIYGRDAELIAEQHGRGRSEDLAAAVLVGRADPVGETRGASGGAGRIGELPGIAEAAAEHPQRRIGRRSSLRGGGQRSQQAGRYQWLERHSDHSLTP